MLMATLQSKQQMSIHQVESCWTLLGPGIPIAIVDKFAPVATEVKELKDSKWGNSPEQIDDLMYSN